MNQGHNIKIKKLQMMSDPSLTSQDLDTAGDDSLKRLPPQMVPYVVEWKNKVKGGGK